MPLPSGGWVPPTFGTVLTAPLPEPHEFVWASPHRFPLSGTLIGIGIYASVANPAAGSFTARIFSEPGVALVDSIFG